MKITSLKITNKAILCKIICTFFGIGKTRLAPGTFGSMAAFPLFYLFDNTLYGLIFTVLLTILGVYTIFLYSTYSPKEDHDPKEIVIDEVCGQLTSLYLYQLILGVSITNKWCHQFMLFIMFRIFDIVKPFPIYIIDNKMRNPFGVMLDDLIAGLMACFAGILVIKLH